MKYKIVIVDDERKILQLIKKLGHWDELGIEIAGECRNGKEAFESIMEKDPDIVLSDIKMPIYDGIQLIEKVRRQDKDTFFILLSGYRHFEYARSAIQLNVMDYLLKPINEQQLNETLQKVCKKVELKRRQKQLTVFEAKHEQERRRPFWEMLSGTCTEVLEKELQEEALCNQSFGTEFKPGCYQVVCTVTNLNAMLEHQDSMYSDKIAGFIKMIFRDIATVYYHSTYMGHIIVLNYPQEQQNAIQDGLSVLFCDIRDLKEIYGEFRVNFGCSSIKRRLADLKEAFMEASGAEWGRLNFMGNSIIGYQQIAHLKRFRQDEFLNKQMQQEIQDCVKYLRREKLGSIFGKLHKQAAEFQNANPLDMRCEFLQLVKLIRSVLINEKETGKFARDCYYAYLEARNFQQVLKNLYVVIDRYLEEEENRVQEKLGKPMSEAIRYMEKNYTKQISMEDTANAANVSSGYLSKLFKKEMQMGFNEVLTQMRMERSKELLAETNLAVKEIAANVGYPDEKYYSKLFRKTTGIKPTDYRRLYGS